MGNVLRCLLVQFCCKGILRIVAVSMIDLLLSKFYNINLSVPLVSNKDKTNTPIYHPLDLFAICFVQC